MSDRILLTFKGGGLGDLIAFTGPARSLLEDYGILTDVYAFRKRWGHHEYCRHAPYIATVASPPPPGPHLFDAWMFREVMSRKSGEEGFDLKTHGEVQRSRVQMAADVISRYLGKPVRPTPPVYETTPEERAWADEWFKTEGVDPGNWIGFQPIPTNNWRLWPRPLAGRFIDLCERAGYRVLVFHSNEPQLHGLGGYHVVSSPLWQTMALLQRCPIHVAVDSGTLHMAAAMSVPSIGLFGSTSGKALTEHYPQQGYIQGYADGGCQSPCHRWRGRGFNSRRCDDLGCDAMWDIKPEAVLAEVQRRLAGGEAKA